MQSEAIGRAPAVTLKANGHGRRITFDAIGTTTVVVCVARETSDQALPVRDAVRERWPEASDVLVINLADGRPFPRLIRKIAEQIMKSSYNSAVAHLKPGRRPEDYVLIVPDWEGAVLTALGLEDVSKTIAVAVIDKQGDVIGVYQGDDPPSHAVALLERANI
jgi:hypothetical protein